MNINLSTREVVDHGGATFEVNAEATGWTTATWHDDDEVLVTAAYVHEDGTIFVPRDCQGGSDEDQRTWMVEATTGQDAVMVDGIPLLPPWSPEKPTQDAERISRAQLRVWGDWLGLPQRSMADLLGVREDTIRRWLAGKERIPVRVGAELKIIDAYTARVVSDVVDALSAGRAAGREPVAVIYRSDQAMWDARPELGPQPNRAGYPATWWRMIIARAAVEVPGVGIEYA